MNSIIFPQTGPDADCAPTLNQRLAELPDGSTLTFEKGEYLIGTSLLLKGKKHVTIDGCGSTLIIHNDTTKNYRDNTDAMHVEECFDVTLRGFTVRMEHPSNVGARIVAIEKDHIDIELNQPLTGKEIFNSGTGFGESGKAVDIYMSGEKNPEGRCAVIAGEIPCSHPEAYNIRHEMLGGRHCRIFPSSINPNWRLGMLINIKHFNPGLSAFVFRNTRQVAVEDFKITDWGGMFFMILPRCADFAFRRVRFILEDVEKKPYCCIYDAIHTTGLGGYLKIENCYFDGIGDDLLNLHTVVLTVKKVQGNELELFFDKPFAFVPPRWAYPGDTLYLYDGKDQHKKAELHLAKVDGGRVVIDRMMPETEICEGDRVFNSAHSAAVTIRNCTAYRSRSRIVIQSASSVEISGCHIDMSTTKAPVYLSSGFSCWGEGGEVKNVYIHDNTFCCIPDIFSPDCNWRDPLKPAALWIRLNDPAPETLKKRYENVRIVHNHFRGKVIIGHVDHLEVTDNVFDRDPGKTLQISPDCTDVKLSDNLSE